MSYTRNSPIQGTGVASAEAIQAWFAANAARGASWVGLPVAPIPADLGVSIVRSAGRYGFNSDEGAAQIAHETAFGQSRIFRDKLNPAGIGAENDDPYRKALTYTTVGDGCDAWAAHLAGYVLGDGPWNALSPRYAIVKANGWAGIVRVLADLEQRWAWTPQAKYDATPLDQRYGAKVAALANDLVDFANNQTWEPPMADIPIIQMLLPVDASNTPRRSMTPLYITIHETANPAKGANAVMHGRWLLNLANDGADEPSWHYTVDDHQIVQHMPINRAGWHAGDGGNGTGNMESIGIELCVNSDGDIQKTRDNAAWLVRKLRSETGIPADRVVQHNHWSGKDCPRLLRQSGWAAFIASIQDAPEPTPEQPVDKWVIPDGPNKGAGFQQGFRAWLETQARARFPDDLNAGALAITGYPEADEYGADDGCSYQVCQRMTLRWMPNTAPPWDIVPLLRDEPIPPPKGSES